MHGLLQDSADGARVLMKKLCATLATFLMLTGCCATAQSSLTPKPEIEPELFGAGVLSVGEIYRGNFAPDGRAFYFGVYQAIYRFLILKVSQLFGDSIT